MKTPEDAPPRRSRMRQWRAVFLITFLPALMLFAEMVARASLTEAVLWAWNRPIVAAVSTALTGALFLCWAAVAGFRFGGLLTLLSLALLSAIHATKQLLVGQPLFPWDFLLSRQGVDIFSEGYFPHPRLHVLAFVAATLVCAGGTWLLPRPRLRLWHRLAVVAVSAAFILSFAFYRYVPNTGTINGYVYGLIYDCTADQPLNYRVNGLLLAFTMNVQMSIISAPPQYSPKRIQAALRNLEADGPDAAPASVLAPASPVDLIVVMAESFWDPAELPGVTYRPDPTPYLRSLPEQNRGWLISPIFGGWTCNTEFEFLTSCSMSFLPRGAVPFQQYVRKPMPSLLQLLGQRGYRTMFMHPYHKWYWQRESVYPLLGAKECVFLEDCGPTWPAGYYTADAWLAQKIIDTVESNGEKPLCLFAVTMQNHGPYDDDRYGLQPDIAVESNLPPESRRALAVYAQGAADSDRMLKTLADYIRGRSRPTLLVFFGDHLPYLGRNYKAYRETGFIGSKRILSSQERYRLRRVPIGWCANFPVGSMRNEMSTCFLAPWILRQMGLEPTLQMRLAEKVARHYPVLTATWYMDPSGKFHELRKTVGLLEDYRLLQYDLLFGKQYALRSTRTSR